jgi:hypothetical protein
VILFTRKKPKFAMREEQVSDCGSITLEEWNGSSSTKLFKTATITASSSLSIQRFFFIPL